MSADTHLTREEAVERLDRVERMLDNVYDDLVELEQENQELREDHDQQRERIADLEREVARLKADGPGDTPDTKVGLAMKISREEAVRVSRKGLSGGAIDWPTVRDIADRQFDTELNSGTVYSAWDRLEDEWDAFHVRRGEDGPNTKNKQLACDREAITESLRQLVTSESN